MCDGDMSDGDVSLSQVMVTLDMLEAKPSWVVFSLGIVRSIRNEEITLDTKRMVQSSGDSDDDEGQHGRGLLW